MLFATILVLAASHVAADSPKGKYCCVPDQWEAYMGLSEGLVQQGQPAFVQGVVHIFYDYTNKRLAEYVNVTTEGVTTQMKIVMDYNKNIQYTIQEKQKTCKASPAPPLSRCVPDTARETGKFYFGTGNDTLKVVSYEVDVPAMQLTAIASMTAQDCVPVGELVYGATNNVPFLMSMGYVDTVMGIRDPSVFNLPSYCKQAEETNVLQVKTGNFLTDYLHRRYGFFQ